MNLWPHSALRSKPPTTQKEFRGINKLDPFSIRSEFFSDSKNLISNNYPALTVRPGFSVLGQFGGLVLGLGVWKDKEIHAVFDDGTCRRLNGDGTWTQLASGLSTTAEWTFTNYQGNLAGINLIGSNGVDPIKRYDGTSVQNLANAPSGGNFITTYQNRLWCAVGNELRASSLDMADEWTNYATPSSGENGSFGKVIESPNGETINGLFGELAKLTVSFPNSIKKLLGGVPSDFNDQSVSQTIGIVNSKCAVTLDGMMAFFNSRGFYQYGGGVAPAKDFSEVVQYYADTCKAAARGLSAVGTDGEKLYFSIPLDGGSTPDTILVYDPKFQSWNVWKGISALHFAQMGNDLYIGDASGRVLKLGGTSDNGTPIEWYGVSKPFTARSMSQTIRWMKMHVTVDLPAGSQMNVFLSKSASGDADWEPVGSITSSDNLQRYPFNVTSDKVQNAQQIRFKIAGTGPATIHEVAWNQDELPLR
jgi:hypothetical protein